MPDNWIPRKPEEWRSLSQNNDTLSSFNNGSDSFQNNSNVWDDDGRIPDKIKELARVRGLLDSKSFQAWTQPRLSDLRDPSLLLNMNKAIERLVEAHVTKEKMALYGDFDLDGTSALALLKTAFLKLGFSDFVLYQPSRLTEGYGLHVKAVESLHLKGVKLIITVDVGITAIEAAKKSKTLGIDLIITDHHLPTSEKPEAFALINPNQGDCPSELNHLSGVGVAFYLVWALRRKLIQVNRIPESALNLKELLDCFVIGTLTDMVPLRAENRVLVKHGLAQLSKTNRPGIRYLLKELGLYGKDLTSQDVAIRLAPKINALSRMELNLRPLDLFVVEEEEEAKGLISQVLNQNEMRVSLQADAERLAISQSKDWDDKQFIFIIDKSFHKGVVGLVATRLSQLCNKPAFVGAISDEGIVVGSARAPQNWRGNLVEVLSQASLFLHRFGGHAQASGFEFSLLQKEEIIKVFDNHFTQRMSLNTPVENIENYDIELALDQITPSLMAWIDYLGPFGQSFEAPIFKILNIEVSSIKKLKGEHRRVDFICKGIKQEALLFGPTEEQLVILNETHKVDVLVEMQWNYFRNQKKIQLLIKAVRPSNSNIQFENPLPTEMKLNGETDSENNLKQKENVSGP